MNEIINENKLFVDKKNEFDNPLIQNINSIINTCYRDCHDEYFHTLNTKVYITLILQMLLIME